MNHRDGEKRVEAYARRSQHTTERRLFRAQGHFPAYRCRACKGYYTRLTGTVFAKTRQRPVTLALLLRGVAKGEPTARLARELGLSRKLLHTLRQRIQANLNATALTQAMAGTAFEADELSQNAGEKARPIAIPPTRHGGAAISAKAMAPAPTIAHPSAV